MKKIELNQMELIEGGGPCAGEVACTAIAIVSGLVIPFLGVAYSIICLAYDCGEQEELW